MNKTPNLLLLLTITATFSCATAKRAIQKNEVVRLETTLAADDMMGRKTGSPGIEKAADFIVKEFRAAGLQVFDSAAHYRQNLNIVRPRVVTITASLDGKAIAAERVAVVTTRSHVKVSTTSNYETAIIGKGANFSSEISKYSGVDKNFVVFIDSSFSSEFARIKNARRTLIKSDFSTFYLLGTATNNFQCNADISLTEMPASNLIGMLPGKSLKDEFVIFSAHYDHLGTAAVANGDSIYNGANDDASGVTAIIQLARYFKAAKQNERTLLFVAFTAEELGTIGSKYFSKTMNAEKTIAMFNIEMIGTESKWGKGSAYITGFEETDMGKILQKNLTGTSFTFHPDPYLDKKLFYRSDNATLARKGVPAHTISTSKMDNEPNYHKVSDDISTLDLNNMTEIIKAIAVSSISIIRGKDTPTRVKGLN